jgi:hypothetical protein
VSAPTPVQVRDSASAEKKQQWRLEGIKEIADLIRHDTEVMCSRVDVYQASAAGIEIW